MKIKSAVFSTGLKLNSRVRISPSAPKKKPCNLK
nr:MAG TPA: hypothetical protein [Bacteriophage sp.]DAL64019.1 MAG TPA_asm: hypothetical protein [Caudoviricetes sp.]DAM19362.1 MAG TPA: hypothetical protein [Caudoviricetes sp.]DAQ52296.1 MAG TPA: hypothetical protein [Caudoviricetes sp.]